MEDYIDDILEKLSDEELIKELEDREFVVYETAPLLDVYKRQALISSISIYTHS